jgi:hypothetical protein
VRELVSQWVSGSVSDRVVKYECGEQMGQSNSCFGEEADGTGRSYIVIASGDARTSSGELLVYRCCVLHSRMLVGE